MSYEGYDSQGNKCVEATANPDGTTTFKNTSDSKCTVQIGENTTLNMASKSEVTIKTNQERTTGQQILNYVGKVWRWTQKAIGADHNPPQSKSSAVGVRGQCDPFGITGGCKVDKGSAWIAPPWLNPMAEIKEAEEKGLVEKLKWQRVNPNPESPTNQSGGPTPSKTYPGESTRSGFEKEKESKVSKGGQIINPSGERGTGHPSGFDFCGRHLPSPEEYASRGFDPGRITDPADRSWNGRIEQVQNDRTLVWSKTIKRSDGSSVKVEKTYKDGSISSISYQFFGKNGERSGYINYDSKTSKIDGLRLK